MSLILPIAAASLFITAVIYLQKPSLFVELDFEAVDAVFSDNYFHTICFSFYKYSEPNPFVESEVIFLPTVKKGSQQMML